MGDRGWGSGYVIVEGPEFGLVARGSGRALFDAGYFLVGEVGRIGHKVADILSALVCCEVVVAKGKQVFGTLV